MQTMYSRTNGGRSDGPPPPRWPSFTGVSQYVGTSGTGRVTVYVDPALGVQATQNARDLVADADRVVAENDRIFGTAGGPVSVIVFAFDGATDGTGGADHLGCDYSTGAAIEVCASYGRSARVSALFEAELSECSMGGDLCGRNTGEALSRWCASVVSGNALADFASAPDWAISMQNFVDVTDGSDTNPISTGCGMAFLSWLIAKGYGVERIAPAMVALGDAGTLAELYAKLTGADPSQAWPLFSAAVRALPGGVNDDDPFRGSRIGPAAFAPWTAEIAGRVFASIFADVAAGRADTQILAGVRTALASSSNGQRAGFAPACSVRSHRLRANGYAASYRR